MKSACITDSSPNSKTGMDLSVQPEITPQKGMQLFLLSTDQEMCVIKQQGEKEFHIVNLIFLISLSL